MDAYRAEAVLVRMGETMTKPLNRLAYAAAMRRAPVGTTELRAIQEYRRTVAIAEVGKLFHKALPRWKTAQPSLALRELQAVARLLRKQVSRG